MDTDREHWPVGYVSRFLSDGRVEIMCPHHGHLRSFYRQVMWAYKVDPERLTPTTVDGHVDITAYIDAIHAR